MDNERSTKITIGGDEYELILTTKATKAIAGRYGGLENLGEKLLRAENFEASLEEICWLIALLANQSILIYNLKNKDAPKSLLTEDEVELLTSPLELSCSNFKRVSLVVGVIIPCFMAFITFSISFSVCFNCFSRAGRATLVFSCKL